MDPRTFLALAVLTANVLLAGCGGYAAIQAPAPLSPTSPTTQTTIADQIGVTNVSALYQYNKSESLLDEGRNRMASNSSEFGAGLGTHVMKLWLSSSYATSYPNTTDWGTINSLSDLANSPPYTRAFNDPNFNTYILESFEFCQKTNIGTWGETLWKSASFATDTTLQKCVHDQFYALTQALLTHYNNSGKTFVLQNWESDNALAPQNTRDFSPTPSASQTCPATDTSAFCVAVRNMILWLQLRQQGVSDARKATSYTNVTVAAAAEINQVPGYNSSWTYPSTVDLVIPSLSMDLYSCSCYPPSVPGNEYALFGMLDYLKSKRHDSAQYGSQNIYVGEFATHEQMFYSGNNWTETSSQQARVANARQVENALRWGARWAIYWELYNNVGSASSNAGFWLIRPPGGGSDGQQPDMTQTWDYLQNIMGKDIGNYRYVYEAENHFTAVIGGAAAETTDPSLSGGRGLWLSGANAGSALTFDVYVPSSGSYKLTVDMQTGPAHGTFNVKLNSVQAGSTYDTYSATKGYQTYTVYTGNIPAGNTTIDLVVSGKNASATGFDLVADSIRIAP
ncbi:MAG TPA: hypothetical protein VM554_02430 [Acidisarcina sp.]|nr:hypothetical protein [Acidisarcina sp.]